MTKFNSPHGDKREATLGIFLRRDEGAEISATAPVTLWERVTGMS